MTVGTGEIRVMSYNVRSLRDDREALVRIVRHCAPDLLCVQEAPRFLRRRHAVARFARECGLVVITGGGTAAGPLLLGGLRVSVRRANDVLLPRTPGLHQRGMATAVVEAGGAEFAVASTHLSLDAAERLEQAELVLRRLAGLGVEHRVLAGDFNESAGRPAWDRLAEELQDGYATAPNGSEFTSPRRDPGRRLDGVFVSQGIEVLGCGVPDDVTDADYTAASDHRPVLADLRVPTA
ncbi:endonuclease/exonuclease/phosphatase family protein [Embleya sp. NBC_00888]|uniref:endonuclease/exonuclease/phosphatase family protein n=1 Tax=Embleya sp. NBC_00888 TaxID=2975960 RepID=UPI00386DF394|nr:endonuclease/exonuclease/phosphatase family protein [Embleya sp. NBC_00888]